MTVQAGGPPAGSTTIRRVEVLRGTSPGRFTPAFPRTPRKKRGERGHVRPKASQKKTAWINVAARTALMDYVAARRDDRVIEVFELDGAHHVVTFDGLGRFVEDVAGGPTDPETARVLANAEYLRLREDASAAPWRWLVRR